MGNKREQSAASDRLVAATVTATTTTTAPKLVKLPAHAKRRALAGNKIPTARRVVSVRTGDSISAATVNLALADTAEEGRGGEGGQAGDETPSSSRRSPDVCSGRIAGRKATIFIADHRWYLVNEPGPRNARQTTGETARFRNARYDSHSPEATGLSVHALPAIVNSSIAPVNSRSRPRAVPGTRWTRCSLIIAVPDGREGARPASRLRVVPRACFSTSCIIPSRFPPRADASATRASADS